MTQQTQHEDDDDLLDNDEDGAFGESDGEHDGDDEDQDDGEDVEIGDECEPGQNQCDEGFNCEETCTPSYCDDEGRCTADCLITFVCMGNG